MRSRDTGVDWVRVGILVGGLLVGMIVIGVLRSDAVRPVPSDVRVDTVAVYPTAPELHARLRSCLADRQLMQARLRQHGDFQWREATGADR